MRSTRAKNATKGIENPFQLRPSDTAGMGWGDARLEYVTSNKANWFSWKRSGARIEIQLRVITNPTT